MTPAMSRAVRNIAKRGCYLLSLDIPVLDDAADLIEQQAQTITELEDKLAAQMVYYDDETQPCCDACGHSLSYPACGPVHSLLWVQYIQDETRKEQAQTIETLRAYAQHKKTCASLTRTVQRQSFEGYEDEHGDLQTRTTYGEILSGPGPCDCGLEAALAAVSRPVASQEDEKNNGR